MPMLDPSLEWQRLCDHYRSLSEDELLEIIRESSGLTDSAQQALAYVAGQRGLKLQPGEPPSAPIPEAPPVPAYDADRAPVQLCLVWSRADALQVQDLLDQAGIPFFMGPEKATGVDGVTSSFGDGLSVQVMNIGLPWAQDAMKQYSPQDEPGSPQPDAAAGLAIHCPKCHSTEVVFDRLTTGDTNSPDNPAAKFHWTCDSCGHEWEDEGVETGK